MNKLVKHIEKPRNNFTQIPNWMLEGMGELSLLAQKLYLVLYSQGPAFNPTAGCLQKKIRNKGDPVGIETIKRAIAELKQSGWIDVKPVGFNSYEYHIYDRPYHNIEGV